MKTNTSKRRNFSALGLLSAIIALSPSALTAEPQITGSSVEGADTGSPTIILQGTGFGSKDQAAPVLLDRVEYAYENGEPNSIHAAQEPGTNVLARSRGYEDSIWGGSTTGVFISGDRPLRTATSSEHYIAEGPNQAIGNPVAYGGDSGWDTPVDNHQLYVAWWLKPAYTPSLYWRITPVSYTGTFEPGETLDIGGHFTATYIGQDEDGMLNMAFDTNPTVRREEFLGTTVRGLSSGAATSFPTEHIGGREVGYETPGSQKYIRVWEDPYGKEGIRFSWTQMASGISRGPDDWTTAPVYGQEWHLMEFEMDTHYDQENNVGRVRLFTNSELVTEYTFSSDLDATGKWSPTIAQLGINGKVGKFQKIEIDDIYMDSSLQRVVLANAKQFEDITHYELQRPLEWSDGRIAFEIYEGSLDDYKTSYIYVFDKKGNVNKTGIPVCAECKPPPAKMPPLEIVITEG